MMNYTVRFVDDDQMSLDWVLIEEPDGYLFILRRSAVTPASLVEGWSAFTMLERSLHRFAAV